ncbi:J domain-containing protein [Streptomyces jeddahensis]|uniref:Chaperone protein DnaJ n=1 Tax=Streptomyces jeddahensis TaxID=1716141 RepID=A0A177HFT7_9ACTN|nr:J domain-containing protein [Streptomyces jeddahensis]OAH09781.1 chaperone protein DnaJ [Streptomyces jeddahensis]
MAGHATPDPRQDLYAVLGVEPTASGGQITSAYRKLVRVLHPDANPGQEGTGERFAEVVSAYGTLHDPVLREAYDAEQARAAASTAGRARPQGRPGQPVRIQVRVRTTRRSYDEDSAVGSYEDSAPGSYFPDPWGLLWQWLMRW